MTDRIAHTCTLDGHEVVVYERIQSIPNPALNMMPMDAVVEHFYTFPVPDWPLTQIRARRGLGPLFYRLGRHTGLELDDPAFNEAFRVDAEDEDVAIVLLHPEMQAFLMNERAVDWSAGAGFIKLYYRGKLNRKRIEPALSRLQGFVDLVPPELMAW